MNVITLQQNQIGFVFSDQPLSSTVTTPLSSFAVDLFIKGPNGINTYAMEQTNTTTVEYTLVGSEFVEPAQYFAQMQLTNGSQTLFTNQCILNVLGNL